MELPRKLFLTILDFQNDTKNRMTHFNTSVAVIKVRTRIKAEIQKLGVKTK